MTKDKKYKQPEMVNWYQPSQLAATGMKALVSGAFASYADKRELQAALDPEKKFFDLSIDKKEIWIDYISDTGDGFNPTYTVANLVSQRLNLSLDPTDKGNVSEVSSFDLPAGDVLILGGDQVYPTPTLDEYKNRFKIPFAAASNQNHSDDAEKKMFAIPGNHDWYDGLSNFLKLFCQSRWIGKWKTQQNRSYFAIKLPHNYWLWGIDVQLNSDIDKAQIDYFTKISNDKMQAGDKVLLCTAEPAWVYHTLHKRDDKSYNRLKFFERILITGDERNLKGSEQKKFRLVATITGDLHHYSHYKQQMKDHHGDYENHLITAGGGGAFLHPTHNLPDELELDDNSKSKLIKSFPSKDKSKKIANRILGFPFFNFSFWLTLSCVQLLLAWIVQIISKFLGSPFFENLSKTDSFLNFGKEVLHQLQYNPPALIVSMIVLFGISSFADTKGGSRNYGWIGYVHGSLQLILMFLMIWLFSWLNLEMLNIQHSIFYVFAFVLETILISGLMGCLLWGFYLWISSRVLGIHINESFSSLAHEHYKNFLRIHITAAGTVAIYPIGVEKVITKWNQKENDGEISFSSDETAKYYLIEPPIII